MHTHKKIAQLGEGSRVLVSLSVQSSFPQADSAPPSMSSSPLLLSCPFGGAEGRKTKGDRYERSRGFRGLEEQAPGS